MDPDGLWVGLPDGTAVGADEGRVLGSAVGDKVHVISYSSQVVVAKENRPSHVIPFPLTFSQAEFFHDSV
jgi:hypothetical protein